MVSTLFPKRSCNRNEVAWARLPEPEYSGGYLLDTRSTFISLLRERARRWEVLPRDIRVQFSHDVQYSLKSIKYEFSAMRFKSGLVEKRFNCYQR